MSSNHLRRQAAGTLMPGFVGTELPQWLAARLREGLGGVCIFGDNIASRQQLRALTRAILEANPSALIAIDEEGGDVTRLYYREGSPYPGNAILGRIDDLDCTASVAQAVGWELRLAGCSLAFAPDVDINSNPDNPVIGTRSFGVEPELVARHGAAWTRALESTGVAASPKHFPGHGDTAQDSHLALPVIDRSLQQLRERELVPFAAAIRAGARTIMTSHILLPQLDPSGPATFSRRVLEGVLRQELGFGGVIVSDALDMRGASGEIGIPEAAVRALAAGCDLLCIGTKNTDDQLGRIEEAILAAVSEGRLPAARLGEASGRTLALAAEIRQRERDIPVPEYVFRDHAPQVDLAPEFEHAPQVDLAPEFDLRRTVAAFDVRPGLVVEEVRTLVAIDTVANIAVGSAPVGPPIRVHIGQGQPLPQIEGQLVLVGRDNHRHPWVRELIDAARRQHPSAIVVDMGWPDDDRGYADVATFGASRHVGAALELWLAGEVTGAAR